MKRLTPQERLQVLNYIDSPSFKPFHTWLEQTYEELKEQLVMTGDPLTQGKCLMLKDLLKDIHELVYGSS